MKLIATYARVSTANQEEEQTIKNQLLAMDEYAKKNDLIIVRRYVDEGWSGDIIARPGLDQLRQDAKESKWQGILIYDPNRLARRYFYQELVLEEMKNIGIEVMFVTISSPKNQEEKMFHGIRGIFAEYERVKIYERFRLGKLRKLKEGHVLTTEAPYGYRYIQNTYASHKLVSHGYYEIDPSEAETVRKIFRWVADEGYSIRQVVLRLQDEHLPPRKSKRGVWGTTTIGTILNRKAYIGQAHWGSTYAVEPINPLKKEKYRKIRKSSRRKKPEDQWIANNIPVPPIIDRDLFYRAAARLKENSVLATRNKQYPYLLSGKIRCSCGRTRGGLNQRQKYQYYRCNDRIYNFPFPAKCKSQSINAKISDELVWKHISALMSSPDLMKSHAKRWLEAKKDKSAPLSNIENLKKEIGQLREQEQRFNKAYGAGVLDLDKLKEYVTPIRDRLTVVEYQLAQSEKQAEQIDEVMPTDDEIAMFANQATKYLADLSFEAKREIVLNVIDRIIATPDKLEVYGYLPINPRMQLHAINRNRWVTECR